MQTDAVRTTQNKEKNRHSQRKMTVALSEPLLLGTYSDDYDLNLAHNLILNRLQEESNRACEIEKEIEVLERTGCKRTIVAERVRKEALMVKQKRLIWLRHCVTDYESEAVPLLAAYEAVKPNYTVFSFGSNDYMDHSSNTLKRLKVIEDFIVLAKRYVPIALVRIRRIDSSKCHECGENISKFGTDLEGNKMCLKCNAVFYHSNSNKPKKDMIGDQIPCGSNDDSLSNFEKTLKRHQGLQSDLLPSEWERLLGRLDEYFVTIGFMKGEEVRKLPLNKRGRRDKTNRQMLRTALSALKESQHYENVQLIGKKYWGWKLADVRHLMPAIRENIIRGHKYENAVAIGDRKSAIATELRCFLELRKAGFECYEDEFHIPENNDSVRQQKEFWYRLQELIEQEREW